MRLLWETNSRVKRLAVEGAINHEDVIPRTTTDKFPAEAATVRLQYVREKNPWVTVHINGEVRKQMHHWGTGNYAKTMRVSFGRDWSGDTVNGELCDTLNFKDVDDVVSRVKEALEK
tara:strand:+ start:1038 stop:1388 length:351 start_codon:yes stop_codon:yes gene_type:complete